MKTLTLFAVKFLAVLSANASFIWAIIEFILYLVKDKEFNWWSVWTFLISVATGIISLLLLIAIEPRKKTFADNFSRLKSLQGK